jgi:hypothetical protein
MEKLKLPETEKRQDRWRSKSRDVHHFLWHQKYCLQRVLPLWPNSQFCILLWHLMVTAWECAKASPQLINTGKPLSSGMLSHGVN